MLTMVKTFLCSFLFLEVINLSERFAKRWESKRDDQPFTKKLEEEVKPPGPLRPRLNFAVRRIELQVQKLDQATERFSQRDKTIFARIVDAYTKHDTSRANVFANELGEIRKMLSGIMIEAGQGSGMTLNFDSVNEDASKILTEASTVAEQRIKEKFPDLPQGIPGTPTTISEKSSTETS